MGNVVRVQPPEPVRPPSWNICIRRPSGDPPPPLAHKPRDEAAEPGNSPPALAKT